MPLAARTSLLSVGSPFIRKREPRGSRAAARAPELFRSSPTTKSRPNLCAPSASNFSAAAIMLAMMPLASAEPRPQMNSGSSRDAKKGGTVSMCVERVTSGTTQWAKTLKRLASTGQRSTAPPVRAVRSERRPRRKDATASSLFVTDSMSTSVRVSSKRFNFSPRHQGTENGCGQITTAFWGLLVRKRMEGGKETPRVKWRRLLSQERSIRFSTDDSAQVLAWPPNRRGVSFRRRLRRNELRCALFARPSEASRRYGPGYWWLPLLYQELLKLTEGSGGCQGRGGFGQGRGPRL